MSWFSRAQRCVSLSISDVQYVAMSVSEEHFFVVYISIRFLRPDSKEQKVMIHEGNEGVFV